jgi:hypothetical protein
MKVNGACLLRKQSAVNSLRLNDGFDCSSSHCQRWPKRCKGCGVHLRKRLDAISRRHNQVARDMASPARFYDEMLIGQNWRRSSRQSGALCEVPHFVPDDTVMLAAFLGCSGRCFLFLLRADADFFQERLDRLFAAEEFFDRDVDVTRVAWLVDFAA